MFIWMSGLLNLSRMFYTENQRKCFFEKVDTLYEKYCILFIEEMVSPEESAHLKELILSGADVDDWWKETGLSDADKEDFLREKVYKAMFDDIHENNCYWEEVCRNAPAEEPEKWYENAAVKSLLHEFINDRDDPYRIIDQLSDKEIACLTYTIYSIFVDYIKTHLNVSDEDSEYMMRVLYCGEFAQNEWLNLVYGENFQDIWPRVTQRFLYAFLERDYSMGMEPMLFSEFLHDEIISPVYIAVYDSRYDILSAGRRYLTDNRDRRWSQNELDNCCRYIVENVPMLIEDPHFEWYLESENDTDTDADLLIPCEISGEDVELLTDEDEE